MKHLAKKIFAVLLLCVTATSSYAMSSLCGTAYVVPAGEVTFFHSVQWSGYEVVLAENDIDINVQTELVSPVSRNWSTHLENASSGTIVHYVYGPIDGLYEGGGYGVVDAGWYGQDVTYCWIAVFLNNDPDPVFTSPVTFSPNPAVVGETVTANWSTQHATSCTYNGNPVNTQGPLSFTAGMQHNTTFTILCAAANQPTASDSETLTVWECDDNVGAPMGPNSSVIAPVQTSDLLGGGNIGGQTFVDQQKNLDCYQVCENHDSGWRIGGQVLTASSSWSKYTTRLQAPSCAVLNRSAGHIANSQGHELIHSTGMVGAINTNNQKIALQQAHQTQSACLLALSALEFNMDFTFDGEFNRQDSHLDHIAVHYPKTAISCVAGATVETDNGSY